MKIKLYHLVALLIWMLFSISVCLAQDSTNVRISRNGQPPVAIADVLKDENGKKVLTINIGESVSFLLDDGVRLESSNSKSVAVLNGNTLVGMSIDTEAVIKAKKDQDDSATDLKIGNLESFVVKVKDADLTREIVAQSTFLSYKTVKDNFGKKFAQSFFVIQVDIRNEKLNQQFIVQTLDVMLDPNQCEYAPLLYGNFDKTECMKIFETYFIFPSVQQGIRREEVIASGKADLNRSNRNIGFRILAFSASMGTILTGFNGVLGPDGVKGVNVLGTTVTAAANGLFPNTAEEKLENLKSAVPTEDVIIKSKESKTFNIFIPTERVFWTNSWRRYIRPAKDSSKETYKLKLILDMLLLSSATGVLVDNDAPKVQVKSDDNLKRQSQKFATFGEFSDKETERTNNFFDTMVNLKAALDKPSTNNTATGLFRNIVIELRKETQFRIFLDARDPQITGESTGEQIFPALKDLSADLSTRPNMDPALIAKFEDIVIKSGK